MVGGAQGLADAIAPIDAISFNDDGGDHFVPRINGHASRLVLRSVDPACDSVLVAADRELANERDE